MVEESELELVLSVVARPHHTFVKLIELFDCEGIKLVKDGFIQRINLERGELKVFVRQQPPLDNLFSLFVRRPHIYQMILRVLGVFE